MLETSRLYSNALNLWAVRQCRILPWICRSSGPPEMPLTRGLCPVTGERRQYHTSTATGGLLCSYSALQRLLKHSRQSAPTYCGITMVLPEASRKYRGIYGSGRLFSTMLHNCIIQHSLLFHMYLKNKSWSSTVQCSLRRIFPIPEWQWAGVRNTRRTDQLISLQQAWAGPVSQHWDTHTHTITHTLCTW